MKHPMKAPAQAREESLVEKVQALAEALRRAQIAELDAINARDHERTPSARVLMEARIRERLRTQQLFWEAEALLAEHRQKREVSKAGARGPRPNARSALKKRLQSMMRSYFQSDTDFKVFLKSWTEERTLDDLTIEETEPNAYTVTDDSTDESRTYTFKTLRTLYSRSI